VRAKARQEAEAGENWVVKVCHISIGQTINETKYCILDMNAHVIT
jgi:hypothetical protein